MRLLSGLAFRGKGEAEKNETLADSVPLRQSDTAESELNENIPKLNNFAQTKSESCPPAPKEPKAPKAPKAPKPTRETRGDRDARDVRDGVTRVAHAKEQAKEAEEKANAAATALAAKEEASALLEKQVQLTTQAVELAKEEAKKVETNKTEPDEFVPIENKPIERITLDKIFGDSVPTEAVVSEVKAVPAQKDEVERNQAKTISENKTVEVYSFVEQAPHVERPVKKEAQAAKLEDSITAMKQQEANEAAKAKEAVDAVVVENNNDKILRLYKEGMSNVDIAKELGLGVGEVKLVINLFKGA